MRSKTDTMKPSRSLTRRWRLSNAPSDRKTSTWLTSFFQRRTPSTKWAAAPRRNTQSPSGASGRFTDLITHVEDRPGHDRRYAIDAAKLTQALGWRPRETFDSGLARTVRWYLENRDWWQRILDGSYRLERLGAVRTLAR